MTRKQKTRGKGRTKGWQLKERDESRKMVSYSQRYRKPMDDCSHKVVCSTFRLRSGLLESVSSLNAYIWTSRLKFAFQAEI